MAEVRKKDVLDALKSVGFDKPEVAEIKKDFFDFTGYPAPVKKFMLSFEQENSSIEEMYYWMVGHATNIWQMPYVHKITDIFAASESSSLFGDMGGRLTAQQNQASQLMATSANMAKDLFKRVRELRQIRERLAYYKKSDESLSLSDRNKTIARSAENTLKDTWINMIEGGSQNPGSVYGMAKEVGFTILPDLFFQAPPLKENEIKKYLNDLDYNPSVINVLERKLYQFYHWKNLTYKELHFKEQMQKKLIYQHYQNMRLYLNWIKPYLKNIQKLTPNQDLMNSASLISSFQNSMVEIEVLLQNPLAEVDIPKSLQKNGKKKEVVNAVVIMHFLYETKPQMDFHQKDAYHQKGPVHIGRVDAQLRAYGWTNTELEAYKKVKTDEDVDMLEAIDYTLKDEAALLGDDLKNILDEVRGDLGKKLYDESTEKKDDKSESQLIKEYKDQVKKASKEAVKPFGDIFGGLNEIFISPFFSTQKKELKQASSYEKTIDDKKKSAAKTATNAAWQTYKNYKKAHRMITW